jgi:hypothetical protein
MTRFTSVLESLAKMLEIPPLELDGNGAAGLQINDDIFLSLHYDADMETFLLYSPVGMLRDNEAATLAALLEANAFFAGTAGFTLALADDVVILQAGVPIAALDVTLLFQLMERFVHVWEYWNEILTSGGDEEAPTAQAAGSSMISYA